MDQTKKYLFGFLFFSTVIFYGFSSIAASADPKRQAQLEAAFIYQFTNYVKWPGEEEWSESRPFVVYHTGQDDELSQQLNKLAKTKKVKNHVIEVHNLEDISHLQKCEIVVISSNDPEVLQEVIHKMKGKHALIVTQAAGFAKSGAMINFFLEDDRLRFEINANAVKRENLQISSQLLNLAKIVNN